MLFRKTVLLEDRVSGGVPVLVKDQTYKNCLMFTVDQGVRSAEKENCEEKA